MAKELEVSDKAPALSLLDQLGERVSLKDFMGKQVVLYFYPKDDTPWMYQGIVRHSRCHHAD